MPQSQDTVGRLLDELFQALQPYLHGSIEDRDRLAKAHGHAMGRVLPLLDMLTYSGVERERLIKANLAVQKSGTTLQHK